MSRLSGFTLTVAGESAANNANIVQGPISGSSGDNWRFDKTQQNYYHIINEKTAKGINAQGSSESRGANIEQYALSGSAKSDDWCFQDAGDGYYYIQSRDSGMYLDVARFSTAAGGNIHQWSKVGTDNQQWKLMAADGCVEMTRNRFYHITSRHSGLSLNVDGASTANGANIVQAVTRIDNPVTSDNWKFVRQNGENYYHIVNQNSNKGLNVKVFSG